MPVGTPQPDRKAPGTGPVAAGDAPGCLEGNSVERLPLARSGAKLPGQGGGG